VCNKEGCWSSKHTQEERDKSRKRFESRLNQYITEYEGEEDQDINGAMEALIIDYNSDDFSQGKQTKSESFLTSFGSMTNEQAYDM